MQKSYRAIKTFLDAAAPWLEKHQEESKFKYAVRKVQKSCTRLWEDYSEKVNDLDIEHCSVDKAGNIIKNDRGVLSFTKEALRKRNAALRTLFDSEVEVTPFMSKDPPADLTEAQREAFAGFVLPDLAEDEDAPPVGLKAVEKAG